MVESQIKENHIGDNVNGEGSSLSDIPESIRQRALLGQRIRASLKPEMFKYPCFEYGGKFHIGPTLNIPTHCICIDSNNEQFQNLIQCHECGSIFHVSCIFGNENYGLNGKFYCHDCKAIYSDPFWMGPLEHYVLFPERFKYEYPILRLTSPGKLTSLYERIFSLDGHTVSQLADIDRCRLQFYCVLMNDDVNFRLHWPSNCHMEINSFIYDDALKISNQENKRSHRDYPAILNRFVHVGINSIRIASADNRPFIGFLKIVFKKKEKDIIDMMAAEETLSAAKERVSLVSKIEDEEIQSVITYVSLKCPFSGARMENPARFSNSKGCHVSFDLYNFLVNAKMTRKWYCPYTLQDSCVKYLQRDVYLTRVLACLKEVPRIKEIEIDAYGRWRPAQSKERWIHIEEDISNATICQKDNNSDCSSSDESINEEEEFRNAARAAASMNKPNLDENINMINLISDDEEN